MRRLTIAIILVAFASSVVSCKQVGGIFGKKDDEQKKMEEIATKAAEMLAAQQKKEAEEKAKLDQQIESEVQKRLAEEKAKAETQAAEEKQPQKVVERIIVKEKSPNATKEKTTGYLRVYIDKGLRGGALTIPFGRNISTTNGTAFKDNCSSASYKVPAGWQVSLYAGSGYSEKRVVLSGSGSINDLGPVNDKCSSFRWERR